MKKILTNNKSTQLVIDLHRDAIGSSSNFAPTVEINGEKVAQLMFVIGTNEGGGKHPNWKNNLKFAVKVQEKANELYEYVCDGVERQGIVVKKGVFGAHMELHTICDGPVTINLEF